MFQTSLTHLIITYLLAVLGMILGAWLLGDWLRRRRERRAAENIFLCRICGDSFANDDGESLVKCPHCGSLNERERIRGI